MLDARHVTARLWHVSGTGDALLRLSATLEHGTPEQVSAYIPVAVALDGQCDICDEDVAAALKAHPPRRQNHMRAVHLPNLVHKIVRTCFLPQRPSNRAVDPVGHVLNKAWPMRCSVRNFSDIVASYIKREPRVYDFICSVLHASMLGIYSTATVVAELPLRMILYRYYVANRVTQEHLSRWVHDDNYSIVFVAIKEYIAFAVSMVPGLAAVLQEHYNWEGFVHSVRAQADSMRAALNRNICQPQSMFKEALTAIAGVRCFKCPPPMVDTCVLCDNISNTVRAICVPERNTYQKPLRMDIFGSIQDLVHLGVPMGDVACAVGIPAHIASLLSAVALPRAPTLAWRQLKQLECPSDDVCLLLHEFMCAWLMALRIRTYPLPAHITREQKALETSRSTTVYACSCCKQLRAFVVDDGNSTGHAFACGHQKVILDDTTNVLYCGKRVEKASTQSRRMTRSGESGRSYWKAQQSMMCGYCPLLRIDMLGTLLLFFGKLYMLCPSCMCVMCLRHSSFHGDSARCMNCCYTSSACAAEKKCFHCCDTSRAMHEIALCRQVVSVCVDCKRRWMDDEDIMSKLTEDVAHRAINERWGSNRVSVHCARI